MKEIEKRAYQAAIVKATVVKYILEGSEQMLRGKSPKERENSEKLLKNVIEQAMEGYSIDDLAPSKKLSKKEFQDHVVSLVKKVRKKVEDRLNVISKANQ
jgi:hypothetical protein